MLTGVWSREEEDDGRDAEDNGGTPDECKRERNAVVLKWLSFLSLSFFVCVSASVRVPAYLYEALY